MNRFITPALVAAIGLAGALVSRGQTRINLKEQARDVDFANASTTRPVKTGAALPTVCTIGELFFNSTVVAPQNLFGCIAPNSWVALGSGASGSGAGLPPIAGQTGRILTTDGASTRWQFLDGDISGEPDAIRVVRIQNRAVSNTAPAGGQTLVWNAAMLQWEPQTPASGAGTTVTLQNDGTTVGNRTAWNVLPGMGLVWAMADTGSALTLQAAVDTAVIQTRGSAQAGGHLFCGATGVSGGTQFSCSLAPMLTAYTTGMVLHFRPSVDNGAGTITLDIDTLGPKPIKAQDGTSNPETGNFIGGRLYELWYDGTNFRRLW